MKNLWKRTKAVLMALVYVAIYYVITLLVQAIYIAWKNFSTGATLSEVATGAINNLYALSAIAVVISFWIYLLIGHIRKEPLDKVIENRKIPYMTGIMAMCLAVGLRLLVTVYFHYSQNVEMLKDSIDAASAITPELTSPIQLLTALLHTVIIAPLFEELLFRGLVMNEFRRVMRPWAAIGLQAIAFGVMHGVLFQSVFAIVVGAVFGVVYYKTKSLRTVFICHSIFNLSVIVTLSELNLVTSIIVAAGGLILTCLSMAYLVSEKNK